MEGEASKRRRDLMQPAEAAAAIAAARVSSLQRQIEGVEGELAGAWGRAAAMGVPQECYLDGGPTAWLWCMGVWGVGGKGFGV